LGEPQSLERGKILQKRRFSKFRQMIKRGGEARELSSHGLQEVVPKSVDLHAK
jgi:hypothetical protein